MAKLNRSDLRLFILGFAVLLALGAIVVRLWILQVVQREEYSKKARRTNSQLTVRIPSVRGEIRDRNGIPLVQNRASYNVDFYLPDMVRGYRERNGKVPLVTERKTVRGMKKDVDFADMVKIVNSGVIPRLQELDLAREYNENRLKRHYEINSLVPYTYIEDVDFPTIAKFSEHDVGLPGVDIAIRPVRQYLYGAFAAHILGYVGMPQNIDSKPDVRKFNFYQPDVDGVSQIEKSMDFYLRGEPGMKVIKRNVKQVAEGGPEIIPPKPGANVYLTLDARIQYIVEMALRHPSIARAAAVVVDPRNGDILAMASVPSFDPNVFIPKIKPADWERLMKDEAVPIVNRAVSGFPSGSTFKVITALAGVEKGIGDKKFHCSGGVQYGNHFFKCWIHGKGSHGSLGLSDALKVSCNSFFYLFGNEARGETIERMGKLLGLGQHFEHLGIDHRAGTMPGPEWRKALTGSTSWTSADTANIAIGQGSIQASPLQMAMAYVAVANGGVVYEPRLVRTVLKPDGSPALNPDGTVAVPDQPIIRGDLRKTLSQEQIEEVRKGLWKVVNQVGGPGGNGTGKNGKVEGTVVAGKTGTAQASDRGEKSHIAWFCSFAPYDDPRYVVAVMVQGGESGGAVAAPIASHILTQCMALENGAKVALKPLKPAQSSNPFAKIAALPSYSGGVTTTGEADESDSVQNSPVEAPQLAEGEIPAVKPEEETTNRLVSRPSRPRSTPRREDSGNETARPARPNRANRETPSQDRGRQQRPREERDSNFFRRLFERKPKPAPSPPRRGNRP